MSLNYFFGDKYSERTDSPVELHVVERFFNHFFGISTDVPNPECNIIKSIFAPYLKERWTLSRSVDVASSNEAGRGSDSFIHAEYKCRLDDKYEVSLTQLLCATSDGTYELSRKTASLEMIFDSDVKSNEELKNYICIKCEKGYATFNPLFALNNLNVRCQKVKKISTHNYKPIEYLYEYSICADENGKLCVEVELENKIIGTINIDEFISSILNNEYNKIFNCSFKSFEESASQKMTNR